MIPVSGGKDTADEKARTPMMARDLARLLGLFWLLLASAPSPAAAATASDMQTIGNVVVYMGVLPAEMIRSHSREHPEATMHGGVPRTSGQYHVMIALFDAKSGARIENADISARISESGLDGVVKKLEPMQIAGTVTYSNYFPMAGNGPFLIRVAIHVPGELLQTIAEFEHRHR